MSRLKRLCGNRLPGLVMFDLDGTLVDSVPDLAAAIDIMLGRLGRPAAGVEQVRDWVGNGAAILVRRALAGSMEHAGVDDAQADKALAMFLEAYSGEHRLTTVYPGAVALLDWLKAGQVPMSVITNKPQRFVAPLLGQVGLGGYFQWLIGGDTLAQQKPHPAALLHVMQEAGVAPDQSLFVGDSRNDVLAARAADVKVVAVSYGYNHGEPIAAQNPDELVDSLDWLI